MLAGSAAIGEREVIRDQDGVLDDPCNIDELVSQLKQRVEGILHLHLFDSTLRGIISYE